MTHELRRSDLAITDPSEIDRILSAARYATVALADRDQPYLVTLSCGYDPTARRLCFHVAARGRKLDIIARNPRACVTVIGDLGYLHGECAHPYESVVMDGRMRLLDDPGDVRCAMRTLIGQLETPDAAGEIFEQHGLDGDAALLRFRLLTFEIESVTAKRGQ